MRIEVENNHTTLDEFTASLSALREPVELTCRGEVVARVAAAKATAKRKKRVTQKDLDDEFFRYAREMQRQYDAGTLKIEAKVVSEPSKLSPQEREKIIERGWEVLDEAHANAKKHGLSERETVKIAIKACEKVRRDARLRR